MLFLIGCDAEEKEEVLCPDGDPFCYESNSVKWSDKSDTMDWNSAKDYCDELGGRLPTVSELRALIKACPETVTNGKCELVDDCLTDDCKIDKCLGCEWDGDGKYSVFSDNETYWTSSLKEETDDTVAYIGFYGAKIGFTLKSALGLKARCVEQ